MPIQLPDVRKVMSDVKKMVIAIILTFLIVFVCGFLIIGKLSFDAPRSADLSRSIISIIFASLAIPILISILFTFFVRRFLKTSGLSTVIAQGKNLLAGGSVDAEKERLRMTGVHAEAMVLSVEDTRMTINNIYPVVNLTVEVRPSNGSPFQATFRATVSRVAIPRKGDTVRVIYDAMDQKKMTLEA